MNSEIPNSVIGACALVLGEHYYSHSKINNLFMRSGAPGDPPQANCEEKCRQWLKRCSDDPTIDGLEVLGLLLQGFMEAGTTHRPDGQEFYDDGKARIISALARNRLEYQCNGLVVPSGTSTTTKSIEYFLRAGDYSSIEEEFERALDNITKDPHSAITASCSIIEAACKTYIETHDLIMPAKQSVGSLWKVVQSELGLNIDRALNNDQRKIFSGLTSIVDGVGAFRTHIGSAHGRGIAPPKIIVSEARLAVNAAHSLVVFIMDNWSNS